jgi:hypothetical protein
MNTIIQKFTSYMAYPISVSNPHSVTLILYNAPNRSKVTPTYASVDFENKKFNDTIILEAKTVYRNYTDMMHLIDNNEHSIP